MPFYLRKPFNELPIFRMNNAMKRIVLSVFCLLSIGFVSACDKAKDELGLNKQVPDEFKVVKRAPLSLPPDYTLRPPSPGAPRPQEQSTAQEAADTVFGEVQSETSVIATSGESALLSRAGGQKADPNIRRQVDSETQELFDRNKPVAEKLFGIGGDKNEASATVVNAKAESERLEQNAEEGKPVTEGETPSFEE